MARIGYARISKDDQNVHLQMDALEAADCDVIYIDKPVSAVSDKRPEFDKALAALEPGDSLVIWKMDRAFRDLRHALAVLDHFQQNGLEFDDLTENIDTSTPLGEFVYAVQNAFAQLERKRIAERTKAGLAAARKRGVRLGRPRALNDKQIRDARRRKSAGQHMDVIAAQAGVSPRTLYRAVNGC